MSSTKTTKMCTHRTNKTIFGLLWLWGIRVVWWNPQWRQNRSQQGVERDAEEPKGFPLLKGWSSVLRSWTSALLFGGSKGPTVIRSGAPWERRMEPTWGPGRQVGKLSPSRLNYRASLGCTRVPASIFSDDQPVSQQRECTTAQRKRKWWARERKNQTPSRGSRWSRQASPKWSHCQALHQARLKWIFPFRPSAPIARRGCEEPETPRPTKIKQKSEIRVIAPSSVPVPQDKQN